MRSVAHGLPLTECRPSLTRRPRSESRNRRRAPRSVRWMESPNSGFKRFFVPRAGVTAAAETVPGKRGTAKGEPCDERSSPLPLRHVSSLVSRPLSAQADVTPGNPAPPASATATAARVSDQVEISDSSAKADNSSSEASASVISIGGKPFPRDRAGGGAGGKESGEGENKGAPHRHRRQVSCSGSGRAVEGSADGQDTKAGKRSSSASAALATVEVPGPRQGRAADLGRQRRAHRRCRAPARARPTPPTSRSATSHLVLLHSEVDSNAKGTLLSRRPERHEDRHRRGTARQACAARPVRRRRRCRA